MRVNRSVQRLYLYISISIDGSIYGSCRLGQLVLMSSKSSSMQKQSISQVMLLMWFCLSSNLTPRKLISSFDRWISFCSSIFTSLLRNSSLMKTRLQKLSTTYFLKFFLRDDWVLPIRDSFFTMSMNLLIGSSPILFSTSLSIFTNWVSRSCSSAAGFPATGLLYELPPNTRVCVPAKLLFALIFLFIIAISQLRRASLSLSSSMKTVSRPTVSRSNSLASGRVASSLPRHRATISLSSCEQWVGSSRAWSPLTMFLARKRGLLPEKGGLKHMISWMMQPRLQMSAFWLYCLFCTIWGHEQRRVPRKELFMLRDCSMPLASPKSATFRLFWLSIMMFEGFRSRCITFLSSCRYRSTDSNEIRKRQTVSSSKQTPFSLWFFISSDRLHPLTTSITMQRQSSSAKDQQNFMMFGCFSSLQILTSRKQSSSSCFFSLLFRLNSYKLSRFRAYQLTPFLARQTYPKAPCPSSSRRLQLPTTSILKFLFFIIFQILSNSSSMASTLPESSSLNAFRVCMQSEGGFTKCPTSKKGPSSSGGKIRLKIFLFFQREQTYLRRRSRSTLNQSKAWGQSFSSMSSNLIMWQLAGWERTRSPMASSKPSSRNLVLMSLSSMRWVSILMLKIISLQSRGSLSLRLIREVKLLSLKSQMTYVLVVSSSLQMQLSSPIFSRKLPWFRFNSFIRVVTPLMRRKFSLNIGLSSRSLIMLISLGLCPGSNLSRAKTSRPTYQTSSKTLSMCLATSSLVIYRMTLVASGLFITSKSMILENISCVISLGFTSMKRRCSARISISSGGELVISGIISLICTRNSSCRWLRYQRCLVQNRSSCKGLNCSWELSVQIIFCSTSISWGSSLGNLPSRYLLKKCSISLCSSGSALNCCKAEK